MILLRKHRFWSRSAATVFCDHEGCKGSGPADLVLAPTGGLALKWEPGKWHALMDIENPGAPFRVFCAEHKAAKPVIAQVRGSLPNGSLAARAEQKRLIELAKR